MRATNSKRPDQMTEASATKSAAESDSSKSDPTARERKKTPAEREALRAAGFIQARTRGTCCLCYVEFGHAKRKSRIVPGQWLKQMPDGWRPESKYRHAHRRCVLAFVSYLSATTGQQVRL